MDLFPNCQHCIISAGFMCDEINGFLNTAPLCSIMFERDFSTCNSHDYQLTCFKTYGGSLQFSEIETLKL